MACTAAAARWLKERLPRHAPEGPHRLARCAGGATASQTSTTLRRCWRRRGATWRPTARATWSTRTGRAAGRTPGRTRCARSALPGAAPRGFPVRVRQATRWSLNALAGRLVRECGGVIGFAWCTRSALRGTALGPQSWQGLRQRHWLGTLVLCMVIDLLAHPWAHTLRDVSAAIPGPAHRRPGWALQCCVQRHICAGQVDVPELEVPARQDGWPVWLSSAAEPGAGAALRAAEMRVLTSCTCAGCGCCGGQAATANTLTA